MSEEQNKGGRPKGATKMKVTIRRAAKASLFNLSERALSGDERAQELLVQAIASNPNLIAA